MSVSYSLRSRNEVGVHLCQLGHHHDSHDEHDDRAESKKATHPPRNGSLSYEQPTGENAKRTPQLSCIRDIRSGEESWT